VRERTKGVRQGQKKETEERVTGERKTLKKALVVPK
jgi:hypothetical protein